MIVCVCEGVSDRDVREAARRGATTLSGIGHACGAGTGCGQCHERLRRLVEVGLVEVERQREPPAGEAAK